jgi:hypothetical protein
VAVHVDHWQDREAHRKHYYHSSMIGHSMTIIHAHFVDPWDQCLSMYIRVSLSLNEISTFLVESVLSMITRSEWQVVCTDVPALLDNFDNSQGLNVSIVGIDSQDSC